MPNHVTTVLRICEEMVPSLVRAPTDLERAEHRRHEEETRRAYREHTGKEPDWPREELPERFVDFAILIPEPAGIERGGCNGQHEPGVVCWYVWNREHWGTKWNAYDSKVSERQDDGTVLVQFDTAWSHPLPVIHALSKAHPSATVDVMYADEDLGQNCGGYTLKDGAVVKISDIVPGSADALDFAAMIKHSVPYSVLKAEWDAQEEGEPSGP